MRTLIVYESMYGNTRRVAEAIADGLGQRTEVEIAPIGQATAQLVAQADLLIVGAPTHIHGMSSATSRRGAAADAAKPGSNLHLEPDAEAKGVREWLAGLPKSHVSLAAESAAVGLIPFVRCLGRRTRWGDPSQPRA